MLLTPRLGRCMDLSGACSLTYKKLWSIPSTLVLLELDEELAAKSCELGLTWIRRDANQLADDLTNENFKEFSPDFRIPLKGEEIEWRVLDKLLDHANGFYQELLRFKQGKAGPLKVRKSEKLRKLKPW